jgi:hypothetical protein
MLFSIAFFHTNENTALQIPIYECIRIYESCKGLPIYECHLAEPAVPFLFAYKKTAAIPATVVF